MHSLDDYLIFLYVVENGSYSGAAKKLKVTHTTVARRIQQTENRLGVKLLAQTPDGFEPTEAGSLILNQVKSLASTSYEIERKLKGLQKGLSGTINLTMPHDLFKYFLVDSLGKFSIDYPNINTNLSLTNNRKDLSILEADIAIRLSTKPPENLIGQKMSSLRHAIYQNRNNIFDPRQPKKLIVWEEEDALPRWAVENFENCQIILRVNDLAAMHEAVKSGIGVACMPCYFPDYLSDPNVEKLNDLDTYQDEWGIWILSHIDVRHSTKVKLLRNYLFDSLTSIKEIF